MGKKQELADLLADVKLFSHCSSRQRRAIARHAQIAKLPEGVDLIKEGEPGDALFVILEGEAVVYQGGTEEQSIPEPKKVDELLSPKTRAIEHRLRQPISLHFKEVPLKQAIMDLAILSGVHIMPDLRALEAAKINLDSPLSINVDNIDMKSALNLMLNKLQLTYVIENDVLTITTRERIFLGEVGIPGR